MLFSTPWRSSLHPLEKSSPPPGESALPEPIHPYMKTVYIIRILLILLTGCLSTVHAADGRMPIIAYMGVPDWRTSEADFRTLSECGFTVSLYPYASLNLMVKACRYADKYGVKVLGRCPEMYDSPEKAARTLRNENGFFGYFMQDEPSVPEISQQQEVIKQLKSVDSKHTFYINLLPYYNKDWILKSTKVRSYPKYLKAAAATSCQQLSFDYYPITTDGLRATWYHNLEMIRDESLSSGKPFWGFVLSVPHSVYPQPTLAALRLQVYANLAYGAQAIQYFTYWNPGPNEGYDYHDAPISREGKKTRNYKLVQQMNNELRVVSQLFCGAKVISVKHLGIIAEGTSRLKSSPRNISLLKIKGNKGAIVSQIEKGKNRYMVIVNKDYQATMRVDIKAKNDVPRQVDKQLQEHPLNETYTVGAGDVLLIKIK